MESRNDRDIGSLQAEVEELKEQVQRANAKIDEIMDLRSRGQGIFWFICTVLGAFAVIGISKIEKLVTLFSDHK